METQRKESRIDAFRRKVYIIIYGVNTPAGKAFDIILLCLIILSVLVIMMETVKGVDLIFHEQLVILEWIFTILFSIEYALRIFCSNKPLRYIFSFYGIIDLLSILPMFLSVILTGSNVLSNFRILRLLRVFRILKLMDFVQESSKLKVALLASRAKIVVFLYTVLVIAVMIGTLMYYIEGPENGFTSIPKSIFYTIVTLTTVGFGDMVPATPLGQFLSMVLMVTGYGIIAVPTGIVSVEIARQVKNDTTHSLSQPAVPEHHERLNGIVCAHCNYEGHKDNAEYCYHCGHRLHV